MKRFTNILVQVDTRSDSQALLQRATALARAHQAALKIVDIAPPFSWPVRVTAPDYQEIRQAVLRQKETALDALVKPLRGTGLNVTTTVLSGKSSDQIIGEVVRAGHDLVMKTAKGQFSQQPGAFGTTAMQLIRYCPCPVWAYRPERSPAAEKIVVAVDATATDEAHQALNREILEWARTVANGAELHVVHVWSVYGENLIKDYMKHDEFDALVKDAEQEAQAELAKLLEPIGIDPGSAKVHLLRGDPSSELTQFVNSGGYDVLVLGTVARSGISGFLIGNTAESLINRVECSVVAVKPSSFQTPIKVQ